MICDEIFGEQNFITNIVWQRAYAPVSLNKYFSQNHDFITVYAKDIQHFTLNGLKRTEEQNKRYKNPDNDPKGQWKSSDFSVGPAVEKNIYEITLPSGRKVFPPKGRSWLVSEEKFLQLQHENKIWFGDEGNAVPSLKKYLSEVNRGVTPLTLWTYQEVGHTQDAKKEIKELFPDEDPFPTPKPVKLLKRILQLVGKDDALYLDSFAGSGTTMQAAMELNHEDGGRRKCVLVQMPENTEREPDKNMCRDITRERVKRAVERYGYELSTRQKSCCPTKITFFDSKI